MFETAILSQGPQTKRVWATCLGFAGQAVLVGGMLVAPLIWPQALPSVLRLVTITVPTAQAPPPPVQDVVRVAPTRSATFMQPDHVFREPVRVPRGVPQIDIENTASVAYYSPGPVGPVTAPGLPTSVVGGVEGPGARPAPVVVTPPTPPVVTKPPRVTVLQMAEPIQRVNPVYPEMAKRMRVSGKVELMGVLGVDGRIHELKVISGHPFLTKAAADAVMQWVYKPTVLNGQAVEVAAPITVNFILTN